MERPQTNGKHPERDGAKRIYRVGPRRELFTSEAAAVLFHGFLALSRTDQYKYAEAVQRELTARLPRNAPSRKVEEAIRVLREAATLADQPPSIKGFEALRKQHPEWRWPPASTIRRWLGVGSWPEALRRASLPTVIPGDALESQLGPAFTADEALVALRDCASDLNRFSGFNAYHAWAHRPDVKRRPGRRPLSEGPFYRLFGSFQEAVAAAGQTDDDRSAVVTASGQLRSAHYRVSDEQIAQGIDEVAKRLGHPPNSSEYIHAREALYDESRDLGAPRVLPSFSTIMRRFVRLGGRTRRCWIPLGPTRLMANASPRKREERAQSGLSLMLVMTKPVEDTTLVELDRAIRLTLNPPAKPAEQRLAELGFLAACLNPLPPRPGFGFAVLQRKEYDRRRPATAPKSAVLVRRYGSWYAACFCRLRIAA